MFFDYHASRVLPGFAPDSKARMLHQLADDAEVLFALNANDIEQGKRRSDIGITYGEDVLRLMDVFRGMGLAIGGVVITRYAGQPKAVAYENRLEQMGINVYHHYSIAGYPANLDLIVSDEGFGKNDYVKTEKPLVVVTAPGPGSGKLAVCLSQLYNENKHGVNHGEVTVNYNRDVETFPVLKAMMEKIMGESPYQSPTDMGVNMVGNCISDDEVCQEAGKNEIIRRYFQTAEKIERTGQGDSELAKIGLLMNEVGVDENYNPAHAAALLKEEVTGKPAGAMRLPDGRLVTGKTSDLLGAASSLLLNALKCVAGVEKDVYVVSDEALAPIGHLKTAHLRSTNPRLHSDETLIALSISSATNPLAEKVIAATSELAGCDAYFSVIISRTDEAVYKRLGINVCCEPKFERGSFYHK